MHPSCSCSFGIATDKHAIAMAQSSKCHSMIGFLDLPTEVQLTIFRKLSTRKPDEKRWKYRSECFLGQTFPIALLTVCRHFHTLGTHVLYAENEVGINVITSPDEIIGLDLLNHRQVCAGTRTVRFSLAFYEANFPEHMDKLFARTSAVVKQVCEAVSWFPALKEVSIAVQDMELLREQDRTVEEICKVFRHFGTLEASFGLEGFLSVRRKKQRRRVLRQLGRVIGTEVRLKHNEAKMMRLFWPQQTPFNAPFSQLIAETERW